MKIMYSLLIYILIALLNVIKLLIVTFKKYFALNYLHIFFLLCVYLHVQTGLPTKQSIMK